MPNKGRKARGQGRSANQAQGQTKPSRGYWRAPVLLECNCGLDKLLALDRPTDEDSILAVVSEGRPEPLMPKKYHPRIVPLIFKLYEAIPWLAGCKKRQGLFCWPCLIFQPPKTAWNTEGVLDCLEFGNLCKQHELTEDHISASLKLAKLFLRTAPPWKRDPDEYDKEVRRNREAAKDVLEVVGSLVGLCEPLDTETLLRLARQDPTALGAPSDLYQVSLLVLAETLLNCVKEEVRLTPVTVIIDEVDKKRVAITFRFASDRGEVIERFVGFEDYNGNFPVIMNKIICTYRIGMRLASICFGRFTSIESVIPSTTYTQLHSPSHNFSTILCSAFNHIDECCTFFHTVKDFSSWVFKPKIEEELTKRLPLVTTGKWRDRIIEAMFENRSNLIDFFHNVTENNNLLWDDELVTSAHAFLQSFENTEFTFLLFVFNELFPVADSLLNVLLNRANDNAFCKTTLKEYLTVLTWKKKKFDELWQSVNDSVGQQDQNPPKKAKVTKTRLEDYYRELFHSIVDYVVIQCKLRFQSLSTLEYLELATPQNDSVKIDKAITSVKKLYPHIDEDRLIGEMKVVAIRPDFLQKTPQAVLRTLSVSGADKVMTYLTILYKLLIAVPYPYRAGHEDSVRFHRKITALASRTDLEPKEEILLSQTPFLTSVLNTDSFLNMAVNEMARIYSNIPLIPSHDQINPCTQGLKNTS